MPPMPPSPAEIDISVRHAGSFTPFWDVTPPPLPPPDI